VLTLGAVPASAAIHPKPAHQKVFRARAAATVATCGATEDPPFKLTKSGTTVYAQEKVVTCTSNVAACKLGVAIWQRGPAGDIIVAESPGSWITPCPIGKLVQTSYKCFNTLHALSYTSEIFLTVESDQGTYGSSSGYSSEVQLNCS
jgi:hypothetical protein